MEFSPLAVMLLLISLMPVPHAQGSPKAVVSIKPDTHVYSGERVTFRCDVQGGGDTEWTYSWYKNNDTFYKDSTMQEISIWSVRDSLSGNYTCRGQSNDSQSSEISDAVTLTVSERPGAVLSVSPQSWLTEGASVTLSCKVTDSTSGWKFRWYTGVPYRHNEDMFTFRPVPLSDSSRDSYTISPAALKHTGVYECRAERRERVYHTHYSNQQPLWITGESPPVSLIINPNRTQHFTKDSLSLSCEDQSKSTGWRVSRYTHSSGGLDCSWWRSVTGSTCEISFLSTSDTGVHWCESESGENSNPVNITVHDGDVILESPVHPVTEGHHLTLRCLYRNAKSSNLRAHFYKDGSVLQTQTRGKMIIYNISKSDEGFYHCKHPQRGESPKSWVSVRVLISLIPVPHAQGSPKAVVSIKPDTHVYSGETVTFRCDVQGGGDTEWTYSWYWNNDTLDLDRIHMLDTDSTMQEISIRFVRDSDSGDYTCRGQSNDSQSSEISDAVTLTVSGESPPVSLIINPSRTQHFTNDSLSLSCEDQSNSTGWRVRRYTHSEGVLDCSRGSVTGSTCNISFLSTSYTGVYWCESESGENSNPVNITVHDGDVILESPVHPVTEEHPPTLRCLYRYPNSPNLRDDFYKDGSVLQTQTTGEMIIRTVSKSDEGFYHCKHPERGESPKSWVSVRRVKPSSVSDSRASAGTVGVAVGLGFLFIALLILMILLWSYKRKKENQTSEQNQIRSGAEDSQSGHTPLQAGSENVYAAVDQTDTSGTAAAESREDTYAQVTKKKKTNRNNGADAEPGVTDVTYAEIELKPMIKTKRMKENASVGDDTVYSELKHSME
ncbi:Fc receptor-like protein 5 isoform X2 [Ictalurus punctatus]|uniref:Fc receptor-like protein 5 isoform X2 n=1 Tax=Ictalurus punctatus TaxID=7998 RepID=A0A9F7RJ04_ICTPU|nr:Fc receptor-like protein 5 isoform X2 [Ictalurus punctatus]